MNRVNCVEPGFQPVEMRRMNLKLDLGLELEYRDFRDFGMKIKPPENPITTARST